MRRERDTKSAQQCRLVNTIGEHFLFGTRIHGPTGRDRAKAKNILWIDSWDRDVGNRVPPDVRHWKCDRATNIFVALVKEDVADAHFRQGNEEPFCAHY